MLCRWRLVTLVCGAPLLSTAADDLQRTHWYSLAPAGPLQPPAEYVDYHLSPESAPVPATAPAAALPSLVSPGNHQGNVTARLGQTVSLKCSVSGFRQGVHTVSWTKTALHRPDPIALTFNDKVFVSDSRFRVYIDIDTWVLVIQRVGAADRATYECHVNSEPPLKLAIRLSVQVPELRVTDGFGRPLADQYYKAGSSLEVVCQLDSLPYLASPTGEVLQWRHHGALLAPRPLEGLSIQSEPSGEGVTSRLAITQAGAVHSGNYTCSVPHLLSAPVRIHILDDENQAFVASGHRGRWAPGRPVATLAALLAILRRPAA